MDAGNGRCCPTRPGLAAALTSPPPRHRPRRPPRDAFLAIRRGGKAAIEARRASMKTWCS
jgi:hypothetical protein